MNMYSVIDKFRRVSQAIITIVMLVCAFLWVIYPEKNIEPIIALLGLVIVLLTNIPVIYRFFGGEPHPMGEGVIGKGTAILRVNTLKLDIELGEVNSSKADINYSPENMVRAYVTNNRLFLERRSNAPKTEILVDWLVSERS